MCFVLQEFFYGLLSGYCRDFPLLKVRNRLRRVCASSLAVNSFDLNAIYSKAGNIISSIFICCLKLDRMNGGFED